MNMPGFTAADSLYKTSGHYRISSTSNDLVSSRGVLPQLLRAPEFCMADCDDTVSNPLLNFVCKLLCLEQPPELPRLRRTDG